MRFWLAGKVKLPSPGLQLERKGSLGFPSSSLSAITPTVSPLQGWGSIRTGTDVSTCKHRPSRSQCIKQRAEAQKGEGTCLKPHSKLGTEQGTEPRAPALCCSSRRLNICKKGTSLPVLVCPRLSSQHSPQTASSLLPACTQVRATQTFPYKWGSQKPSHKGCSSKKWVYSDSSGPSLWMTKL